MDGAAISNGAVVSVPLYSAAAPTIWNPYTSKACDHSKSLSEPSLHRGSSSGCASSSSSGIRVAVAMDRIAALPLAVTSCAGVGVVVVGVVVTEGGKSVLDDAAELRVVVRGARLRVAGDADGADAAAAAAVALRSVFRSVSITSSTFPHLTHTFFNFHWLMPFVVTSLCSHSVAGGWATGAAALAFAFAFASVWRLLRFS